MPVGGWAGPALVLGVGLALTALTVGTVHRFDRELEARIAIQRGERMFEGLEARFDRLLAVLARWDTLIHRNPQRTSEEWGTWFDRKLRDRFPEVREVGYGTLIQQATPAAPASGEPFLKLSIRLLVPAGRSLESDEQPPLRVGQILEMTSVSGPDRGDTLVTLRRSFIEGKTLLSGLIRSPEAPASPRWVRLSFPVSAETTDGDALAAIPTGAIIATLDLDQMLHYQVDADAEGLLRRCRVRNDDQTWTALGATATASVSGDSNPIHALPEGSIPAQSRQFFGREIHCDYSVPPHPALVGSGRRTLTVGGLGVMLTLLSAGLVWARGGALRRETRFAVELQEAHGRLAEVTRERERLTRDLHDGTIQSIYAVGFDLQRARNLIGRNPGEARAELTRTLATLNQIVAELREFILQAEPGKPKSRNVDTALQALVERARRNTHAEISLELAPDAAQLVPSEQAVEVVQIVREALTNSLRHAYPRQIGIALTRDGRDWRLTIADDGDGFDPQQAEGRNGHGLRNLQHRAGELGGESVVVSSPGTGTAIRVVFPVLDPGTRPNSQEGDS